MVTDLKRLNPITEIFRAAAAAPPEALREWDTRVSARIEDYACRQSASEIVEIVLGSAVFLFDCVSNRVVLAYGVSTPQLMARDAARIRGFPDVNVQVRRVAGADATPYDRGHFLGHASGGKLDINLFPHERSLNRGWSEEGKRFRQLERLAAENCGTFFFHRPEYVDETWIPASLEYGVLVNGFCWELGLFVNRLL